MHPSRVSSLARCLGASAYLYLRLYNRNARRKALRRQTPSDRHRIPLLVQKDVISMVRAYV